MAYTSLTAKSAGDPVTASDYNQIDTNLDDHETRIANIESGANIRIIWNQPVKIRKSGGTITGIGGPFQCISQFTFTECEIQLNNTAAQLSGFTGSIEFDIKKSTSINGTYSTIFTTKPSISMSGVTDYQKSTNQVFNSAVSTIAAGEYYRVDITAIPSGGNITSPNLVVYGDFS